MAFTINSPASEWRILKYVRGAPDNWYIIKEEALRNGKNNYISVTITMWRTGDTYPHKFKANNSDIIIYKWKNLPKEALGILAEQNVALFNQFAGGPLLKATGKFDHIQPDKVWFVDYGSNDSLYIVDREEYSKPATNGLNKSEWAAWLLNAGYDLSEKHASIGRMPRFEFDKLNQTQLTKFNKLNPGLYKHFEDFYAKQVAVKTEPTPDDYYVVCAVSPKEYYFCLRHNWAVPHISPKALMPEWKSGVAHTGNRSDVGTTAGTNKKFPQLSSEIKQELQKQNPERYKEWEDFYCKKYPNMQRLKPIFDLGTDLSQWLVQCNGKNHYVFLKHKTKYGIWKSNRNNMELFSSSDHHHLKADFIAYDQSDSYTKESLKDYNPSIYDKFEQYYSELEQKKVAERQGQTMHQLLDLKPQVSSDFDIDEKAMAADWLDNLKAAEKDWSLYKSPKTGWFEGAQSQALKNWHETSAKLCTAMQDSIGIPKERDVARGKEAKITMFEEAGPFPKKLIQARIDELQSIKSVWGKDLHGKLVNRLTELTPGLSRYDRAWFERQYGLTPEHYYQMANDPSIQGLLWTKPRRVGMTHWQETYENYLKMQRPIPQSEGIMTQIDRLSLQDWANLRKQFISPNTKTNNHEIINVSRKTITITSGQKCTGNSVSSFRCPPTVTEKYTGNRSQPIRGKESSRGCKIG